MANRIFSNDEGYTEMVFEGDQTSETMFATIKESLQYDDQLSAVGKPIKTLVDLSQITALDAGASKQAIGGVAFTTYDKVAIFGGTEDIKHKVGDILHLAGDESKIKLFTTREEAVAWLKN